MGVSYNPSIVTNGLVLCLDAGNRKSYPGSGTTWTDLSGRGNNGTLVNGVEVTSNNFSVIPWNTSVFPTIGAQRDVSGTGTQEGLNGNISQISIYNRVLGADEIRSNYNSFRIRYLR